MLNRERPAKPAHASPPAMPRRARRMSIPRHGGHAPLLLAAALLALSALGGATAQAPNDDYPSGQQVHVSTPMIALLVAVIAVFVFIACSTIYLRHCTARSDVVLDGHGPAAIALNRRAFVSRSRRPRGLDADVVAAFPTMKYAEAKALRVGGKQGVPAAVLECAVCLSEFEDEERLTLLPKCSHAFHPDCIGEWLAGHVTCPVCRCNLDPNHKPDTTSSDEHPSSFPPFPPQQANNSVTVSREEVTSPLRRDDGAQQFVAADIVIGVSMTEEEQEEERLREAVELQQIGTQRRRAMRSRPGRRTTRLARSHSTGHSLAVRLDGDMERFTLRLPEHVRREMVAASEHQRLMQSRRRGGLGAGGGDGSSRGGAGRSGPLGRAARWQSLLERTFSGTVSFFSASRNTVSSDGGGEVSSTSSSTVRGKRVAAVDAADVPDVMERGVLRLDGIGDGPSGAKAGTVSHEAATAAVDEEKAVTQQVRRT